AIILVMVALGGFACLRLRGIEAQATLLRDASIPGLYIIGKLSGVSIQTHTSVQQHILEQDPAGMQQIRSYIAEKTAERSELLELYDPTIATARERELYDAT